MKKRILTLLLAALSLSGFAQNNPKANPAAVVELGNARFTVLTDRLIRMEWAADGTFEDRASLAIVNRELPVPSFKVTKKGEELVIKTAKLTLKYTGGRFSADNLSVRHTLGTWKPGLPDDGNLLGTVRTLDGSLGFEQIAYSASELEKGILSRDGWALVDESERHLFSADGWVTERPAGDRLDWYLFAYGHDYTAALGDFVKVAGRIPMPPKWTLGYWWSRYWIFTDDELLDLGREMKAHDVPMDVMIVDMDWHYTYKDMNKRLGHDDFNQSRGWTGYTWNRDLFPDPEAFLAELHAMGYKTALNLHPASGIRPYEECYPAFVKDYLSRTQDYDGPKDYVFGEGGYLYAGNGKPVGKAGYKASVPYRMTQKAWADAYFNSVIRPLEKQGVDFWWLDWQQWLESRYVKGLSNTFWINHAFFHDKDVHGTERPLIYHRWGGLGSHRYQLGFSGDTHDEWSVLKFLPYFTATASNVGYGYWGHDIGGHMQKRGHERLTDPEMYTRWLQYGVFTPIFKTHSTQSANLERKIWAFPSHFEYMKEAIRLRYTLSPYIYTFAREAYDTGVSLCRPLYYAYPERPEAYKYNEEFLFGDRILATVIAEPAGADGKSAREVWFPSGNDWWDMVTHTLHKGGSLKTLRYAIGENPWYVKAGSILPLAGQHIPNLQAPSDTLGLLVVPGPGKATFRLYEDDGTSKDYATSCAFTQIDKQLSGNKLTITLHPRSGSYAGAPSERCVYLVLEGRTAIRRVLVNGVAVVGACSEGACREDSSREGVAVEGACRHGSGSGSGLGSGSVVVTLPALSATAQNRIEVLL